MQAYLDEGATEEAFDMVRWEGAERWGCGVVVGNGDGWGWGGISALSALVQMGWEAG
jgi:hypothetical protein